jgi:hypothetical protein
MVVSLLFKNKQNFLVVDDYDRFSHLGHNAKMTQNFNLSINSTSDKVSAALGRRDIGLVP